MVKVIWQLSTFFHVKLQVKLYIIRMQQRIQCTILYSNLHSRAVTVFVTGTAVTEHRTLQVFPFFLS